MKLIGKALCSLSILSVITTSNLKNYNERIAMENRIGSPEWFRERAQDPLNVIHDRQTSQSREEFIKKYAPEKLA